MSIFVKKVTWYQTQSEIFVNILINGKKSTDDIIIDTHFLKINIRPHFYEITFEKPICVERSSCKLLELNIKFRLKKEKDEWWSSLGTKEIVKERLHEFEKKIQEEHARQKNERSTWKRIEIDKEIERQSQIRMKIEKNESIIESHQISEVRFCETGNLKFLNKNDTELQSKNSAEVTSNCSIPLQNDAPPIRSCGKINVNFTSREFITPKRESKEAEERKWLAKQHEIMTDRIGFSDKDLSSDERDPVFLLKKGYDFLEKSNNLAAISTFSFGLKLSSRLPELYLGRARAQFALQNYKRCVSIFIVLFFFLCFSRTFYSSSIFPYKKAEDCSDALERLKPEVQSNLLNRIHCYWLRGESLTSLGLPAHGQREIQMAHNLDPHNFEQHKSYFIGETKKS